MKKQKIKSLIKNAQVENKEVILFLLLSYAISWALWTLSSVLDIRILEIAGRFGPLISAVILAGVIEGRSCFQKLFSRLFIREIEARWYIISIFAPTAIVLPAIYINQLITGIKPNYNDPSKWYLIIIAFFYVLFLSVLGEEIGWRGFALPRLLRRFNELTSSLIIGVFWGLWHLPLFYIEGEFHQTIPFWLFMIDNIALSVIMTWLYLNTKGSLLIAHLFHTASNVTLGVLPILPMDTSYDMGALYIAVVILVVFAVGIVIFDGRMKLYKTIKSEVENEKQTI